MENIILGTRYFKYEDDDIEVLTVVKNKDSNNIELRDKNDKSVVLNYHDLVTKYTKLNPDAIINFNIVKIQDMNDVIVTVFRNHELLRHDNIPYSICRQNITDFFANSLSPEMNYCGVNVTKDSLPEGVDMQQLTACDELESYISVSYYLGDTLNKILSYFKHKLYDNILYTLFMQHARYKAKESISSTMYMKYAESQSSLDGYCKTLRNLLVYNNFIYDLYRGFDIYPLDIDLSEDDESCLSLNNLEIIERLLCKNIVKGANGSIVIKYDKDIDLDNIQQTYILVCDKNDNLYVVIYKSFGKYHIPVEKVESPENIELMARSINYDKNSSITEAYYDHIRFNKDKYKQ